MFVKEEHFITIATKNKLWKKAVPKGVMSFNHNVIIKK